MAEYLTFKQASEWASHYLNKKVTVSNISYLVQYGKIRKYGNNGNVSVDKTELIKYYDSFLGKREVNWKEQLGSDLNWELSFDYLKESDTTKHVHRIHPYKGKFIPQLVEYFLDSHTDRFKKQTYFSLGDVILDPFCGSGTTLVQSNELGYHAIGIDISEFNAFISNVKNGKYDFFKLYTFSKKLNNLLKQFVFDSGIAEFEEKLLKALAEFNNKYFPSPDFKFWLKNKEINGDLYGKEKADDFLRIYNDLVKQYNLKIEQESKNTFMDLWLTYQVRNEVEFLKNEILQEHDQDIRNVFMLILSRTVRSCRATTHFDLATLKSPVFTTYYCPKHGKICKPLFSILSWWIRYSQDTISRLFKFNELRSKTYQTCLVGDSRNIDVFSELNKSDLHFSSIVKNKGINGVFSSPPYVGLIDYHEQHAYAYELLGFNRRDCYEIGPLSKGQTKDARLEYMKDISTTLLNIKKYLRSDANVFFVANDKYNIYPMIAEQAGFMIETSFIRPVLNRTERDKGAYSETIFHLRMKE